MSLLKGGGYGGARGSDECHTQQPSFPLGLQQCERPAMLPARPGGIKSCSIENAGVSLKRSGTPWMVNCFFLGPALPLDF